MKAISYQGPRKMSVSTHAKPKIKSPTDALLRVTTSGICGSDLHMYDGRTPLGKGTVVGHEIMGVIDEVGDAVQSIQKGDRVVLPFNIACGFCFNCHRGHTEVCLTMNPEEPHAAYGYAGMGPYQGGQAEFVLVPHADFNCLKLPGKPGDQWEDDFLLLSDVFPTAFHATELACVSAGKSVAVFGAGPVGLLSAYCSLLKGASEVYVVDSIPERLAKATELLMGPQGFHQAINPISRQAEDGIHVPINECLDKNIGCGHDLYSQGLRTNRRSKHQKVNLLSCVARLREGKTSGIASTMLI